MLPYGDNIYEELNRTLKDMKLILYSIEEKVRTRNMWKIDTYLESFVISFENFLNILNKLDVTTKSLAVKTQKAKKQIEQIREKLTTIEHVDPYRLAYEHLDEFREFLREKGLKDMTIYLYIKALTKYINNEKLTKTERTYIEALNYHVNEFVKKKMGLNT